MDRDRSTPDLSRNFQAAMSLGPQQRPGAGNPEAIRFMQTHAPELLTPNGTRMITPADQYRNFPDSGSAAPQQTSPTSGNWGSPSRAQQQHSSQAQSGYMAPCPERPYPSQNPRFDGPSPQMNGHQYPPLSSPVYATYSRVMTNVENEQRLLQEAATQSNYHTQAHHSQDSRLRTDRSSKHDRMAQEYMRWQNNNRLRQPHGDRPMTPDSLPGGQNNNHGPKSSGNLNLPADATRTQSGVGVSSGVGPSQSPARVQHSQQQNPWAARNGQNERSQADNPSRQPFPLNLNGESTVARPRRDQDGIYNDEVGIFAWPEDSELSTRDDQRATDTVPVTLHELQSLSIGPPGSPFTMSNLSDETDEETQEKRRVFAATQGNQSHFGQESYQGANNNAAVHGANASPSQSNWAHGPEGLQSRDISHLRNWSGNSSNWGANYRGGSDTQSRMSHESNTSSLVPAVGNTPSRRGYNSPHGNLGGGQPSTPNQRGWGFDPNRAQTPPNRGGYRSSGLGHTDQSLSPLSSTAPGQPVSVDRHPLWQARRMGPDATQCANCRAPILANHRHRCGDGLCRGAF